MRIVANWITDQDLQLVLRLIREGGHQALLVGGCVRNGLLGVPVDDIDIATDAHPERVLALAKAAGLRVVPTGIEHGTVTVVANSKPFEVTTFRRDVETDGRRATVAFATSILDDAARRDFTMNALYADHAGQVIDPLGGLPDLQARRVRFVGAPQDRIREDYLRILRFFRFHARYGDPALGLDADGLAACAGLADGITTLSRERIGHEMRKLLAAPDPAPSLAAMQAAGILARIIPGADIRAIAPLVHLEAGLSPDPLRRLAALGGADLSQALRLSRGETRALAVLQGAIGALSRVGELGYRHGPEVARDIVLLRAALLEQPLPADWQGEAALGAKARFPVQAADLAGRFSGPALGEKLRVLEAKWIESGFQLTRAELLG
ncbi:MAG: CCA tRNA nucleotidyltransferase [Albidovulum sp.]